MSREQESTGLGSKVWSELSTGGGVAGWTAAAGMAGWIGGPKQSFHAFELF
jgi:hypothetical protein